MPTFNREPTQISLKEILHYEPKTGIFKWIANRGRFYGIGRAAGTKQNKGYLEIQVYGKKYLSHRLAWLYMTGQWPKAEIDHVNRIRNDNRWENLREATDNENHYNNNIREDNTIGDTGINLSPSGFQYIARIQFEGKRYRLGGFNTYEEAVQAYENASKWFFGKFARVNSK